MRFIFALLLFLSVTFGQVNDKNFKEKINGGVVVAVFTSEWQEQELDEKILKGVEGYQDCEIIYVASEQAKKVVKKLRFRNFPSIALFFDGSKKETSVSRLLKAVEKRSRDAAVADSLIAAGEEIRTGGIDGDTVGDVIKTTSDAFDEDSKLRKQLLQSPPAPALE